MRTVTELLDIADSRDLSERYKDAVSSREEGEARTDNDILNEELLYLLDLYAETGTGYYEDLKVARRIMRETKNGTEIPMFTEGKVFKYSKDEIVAASAVVDEYKRLKQLKKIISNAL